MWRYQLLGVTIVGREKCECSDMVQPQPECLTWRPEKHRMGRTDLKQRAIFSQTSFCLYIADTLSLKKCILKSDISNNVYHEAIDSLTKCVHGYVNVSHVSYRELH